MTWNILDYFDDLKIEYAQYQDSKYSLLYHEDYDLFIKYIKEKSGKNDINLLEDITKDYDYKTKEDLLCIDNVDGNEISIARKDILNYIEKSRINLENKN